MSFDIVSTVSSEPVSVVCLTVAAERDIVLEVNEHIKPEVMADLMEWVCTICRLHSMFINYLYQGVYPRL